MADDLGSITMLTYVKESPAQLRINVERRIELTQGTVEAYLEREYRSIWIIACGSSFNASHCAVPFMRKYLGRDVFVVNPGSFLYSEHAPADDTLCLVVSQSGCSTNSIAALDRLREMGIRAIGITGNLDSDFRDHADLEVDYGVGTEYVGYVTKGVVTLAEFLMLFALEAGHAQGTVGDDRYHRLVDQLSMVADVHSEVQLRTDSFYDEHRRDLLSIGTNYVLGFDQAYGVACEGALKFGETMKVPSFAYEAEEYNHGPHLQLTPAYTVFCVDDMNRGHERIQKIYREARYVSPHAFLLTGTPDASDPNVFAIPEKRPAEPLLEPLYLLPFFQIVAYRATTELDCWRPNPLLVEAERFAPNKTENIKRIMPIGS
jgi:glucoselysine-6-phosphate deglycase